MSERARGLDAAAAHARRFLESLDERPVAARGDAEAVRAALGGPLPVRGEDPEAVRAALGAGAAPGLRGPHGPPLFRLLIGGAPPPPPAARRARRPPGP